MDTLNSENIFTDEEIGKMLGELEAEPSGEDKVQETEETQEYDEVVEDLSDEFSRHEAPKSVGNRTEPPAQRSGSPTPTNLFNSIAAALVEEGVFPDVDDEMLKGVKDAATFRSLVEKQIESGLNEQQRRISAALTAGVQPNEIQQYEGAMAWLNQINEDMLAAKGDQNDEIRRRLIYQDLMNRGYSHDKALKEVKKSLDAGTDVEDAKDALQANKEYFQGRYNAILNGAKEQRRQLEEANNSRFNAFKKSLLEDKKAFGSVDLDQTTRKRVFDVLTKPTKKDEAGRYYTEMQWAQHEDPSAFSRNIGLLYVLTDGFKNVEKLIDGQVKQRTAKGLADLERVINDTQRNPDGSLRLMSGVATDPESFFDDFELDI